jgi:hypothetical protein
MKRAKKKQAVDGDEILRKVLSDDAAREETGYQVMDADRRLLMKTGPKSLILVYPYTVEAGNIAPMFDTHGFADYIVRRCADLLNDYLEDAKASTETRNEIVDALAYAVMHNFIARLQPKLAHALREHEEEVFILARGLMESTLGKHLTNPRTRPDARTLGKRLAEQIKVERRAFLLTNLDRLAGRPNLERLKEHYHRLLPKWQRAKMVYESVGDLPNWREIIGSVLEDEKPSADLIARVSGRLSDLTLEIQAAVAKKGGDATASSIAIEHAARLCGAKDYQFHTRTLFRKSPKAEAQKVIKSKGVH